MLGLGLKAEIFGVGLVLFVLVNIASISLYITDLLSYITAVSFFVGIFTLLIIDRNRSSHINHSIHFSPAALNLIYLLYL